MSHFTCKLFPAKTCARPGFATARWSANVCARVWASGRVVAGAEVTQFIWKLFTSPLWLCWVHRACQCWDVKIFPHEWARRRSEPVAAWIEAAAGLRTFQQSRSVQRGCPEATELRWGGEGRARKGGRRPPTAGHSLGPSYSVTNYQCRKISLLSWLCLCIKAYKYTFILFITAIGLRIVWHDQTTYNYIK